MVLRHVTAQLAQAEGLLVTGTTRVALPNFLPEDYLALLRAAVGIAWAAIFGMSIVQVGYALAGVEWPELGGFALMYRMILVEFALTAAALSVLAVRRDWFESVPRAASQKLRALLILVVVWLSLHLFAAFYVFGGLHGPLLPLLPVLIVVAFLSLPRDGAWAVAGLILVGCLGVVVLEERHWLFSPGPLATVFSLDGAGGTGVLLLTLGTAFAVGVLARRRLDQASANLNRGSRVNALTGLYEQDFLMARMGTELARVRRQGGSVTLLLIEFDGFTAYTARHGYIVGREALRHAGQVLIQNSRNDMDTPARLAPTTFALLLPDAHRDKAADVAARIRAAIAHVSSGALRPRAGAATLGQDAAHTVVPETLIAAAAQGLLEPATDAPPTIVDVAGAR
jgi:diguanylate cyclase (GGDEF)-like protein